MSWLTRIKDSLLIKIKRKIPKKDIEDIEKERIEKKFEKKETPKKIEIEVEKTKPITL